MRKIGHSSWRFFSSNILSRALLPFAILLFSSLKEILLFPQQGGSLQGWLSVGLSLAFFYTFYISVLKRDPTRFSRGDLWIMGVIWALFALLIHATVLSGIYDMDWGALFQSYTFVPFKPWPFAVIGLFLTPRFAAIIAKKWFF
ncbi:MAG: hypothetical protein A2977_02760 [Alphaproteobacteria bacterium RIFCSPLOWO2_01_FULL_45_8]|nr:MAG: hypothetical protein A2065_03905 [Alphaproteobacteria bacterium GWB1_45_5]OFW75949.1 MAG: hypothetical protein A3K20_03955 [Alphaproteobacteria bacterium GWA1_45_9]OFW90041.1 MAG: hypothetical protein A2621_04160 [Alphaproteobacteria bacterium RIFCSPHIGHO2_01_FULL_41_14]OFW96674.1 MAG: hypothetical protein A2977_02760 [Alphaproteobacteria bacterium RIFCSPLOWO2_01_FULL_45_8]HCI49183.1 hypothetical protein [Holosporales bacterium]